jgi:hypothetical protein
MLTNGKYAVYHLKPTEDGIHKHLASVFALKNGGFHLLEDYSNLFTPYHTHDGDVPSNMMQHRIKNLVNNSAYYKVIPTKEDNVVDAENRHKVVTPQDINSGRQAFVYHSPHHNGPAQLVFDKGSFHLNGYPLSIAELKHIKDSVDEGHSHLAYPDDMFKSESLEKMAVLPKDLKILVRGTDLPNGEATVDHTGHLSDVPDAIRPSAELYEAGVNADPKSSKVSAKDFGGGISRKSVFKVGGNRTKPSRTIPSIAPQDERFMLKPYHEKIDRRLRTWARAHMQGWAEMTNQALYHAGGIGDLHQKVFVAEHETKDGKKVPFLAVHTGKGYKSMTAFFNLWQQGVHQVLNNPKTQEQVRKIAVMDFLTNNLDRHHGNLLANPQTGDLLAIDHSRSFQYVNHDKTALNKWRGAGDSSDKLAHYIGYAPSRFVGGGIRTALLKQSDPYEFADSFNPTMEWWDKNSDNIRREMDNQLKHIKDEKLRHHIKTNFEIRARLLDDFAKHGVDNFGADFYRTPVDIIRPWEH